MSESVERRLRFWEDKVGSFRIAGAGLKGGFPKTKLEPGASQADRVAELAQRVGKFTLAPDAEGVLVQGSMRDGWSVKSDVEAQTRVATTGTGTITPPPPFECPAPESNPAVIVVHIDDRDDITMDLATVCFPGSFYLPDAFSEDGCYVGGVLNRFYVQCVAGVGWFIKDTASCDDPDYNGIFNLSLTLIGDYTGDSVDTGCGSSFHVASISLP